MGDHERPQVGGVESHLEHIQSPTSQDGKNWYEDGREEEAGRKTTKWPAVGRGRCEWVA